MNYDKAYILICIFLYLGNCIKRIWQLGRLHQSTKETLTIEASKDDLMNDLLVFAALLLMGISLLWGLI